MHMAKTPFFSVITPTFDRAGFLTGMVRSVQAQTFTDYEHIIVDDGSTDETESLVSSFTGEDERIIYLKQGNKGRSTARNVGIDRAKGEYICFLDSDDFWRPEHLQGLFETVGPLKQPVFAFTALQYKFPDSVETKHFPPIGNQKPIDYVISNEVSTITVAIHHSILASHQFNPTLTINEDLELWARIVSEHPIVRIDRPTAIAVQHQENARETTYVHVDEQRRAMGLVFNDPLLKGHYSAAFRRRKTKSLRELSIRQTEAAGKRWQLIFELIRFLILYPTNPGNAAKLVLLIYTLPGGQVIKRIFGSV